MEETIMRDMSNNTARPAELRTQSTLGGKVRTKQSFKEDTDINLIFKRWVKGGDVTHFAQGQPSYGDHTNALDYQEKLNAVINADEQFAALPSAIRERFNNEPEELLLFVEDPANREEGEQLGLFKPDPSAAEPPATRSAPSEPVEETVEAPTEP